MILNFDEYTNEGLVNKTLKRIRTGRERIEDVIKTNVDEYEEVDLGLPFVFANVNLIVGGDDTFTFGELMKYMKVIKKTGWRLLSPEDVKRHLLTTRRTLQPKFFTEYVISHTSLGVTEGDFDSLVLKNGKYWLDELEGSSSFGVVEVMDVKDCRLYKDMCINSMLTDEVDKKYMAILVKDKI